MTAPEAIAPEPPAAPAPAPPPAAPPPVAAPVAAPEPPKPDPAEVERRKKEKAEELYNEGVRLFINQKLDDAIRAWEQTLVLNPAHPKAPKDLEKARALQQKLKDIK